MRSFIKTHRRASSLDNSPNKPANESPESRRNSQGSFGAEISLLSTYPPQYTLKQSSSFEPLHKLTSNKIFTSKLFKKNSNVKSHSSNSSPLLNRSDPETFAPLISNTDVIPAIKGTRRHEWGDNDDASESVIILNRTSMSSMSDTNQDTPDTELIRIHPNSRQGSVLSSQNSIERNPRLSLDESEEYEDSEVPKNLTTSRSQSLKKKRNRLARIHSHDDILNMRSQSSFGSELLGNNFSPIPEKCQTASPSTKYEKSPKSEHHLFDKSHRSELRKISEASFNVGDESNFYESSEGLHENEPDEEKPFVGNQSKSLAANGHTITFDTDSGTPSKKERSIRITESDESEDMGENEDDEEDESDSSSKFSFENGKDLAGRTASLKYYSTETTVPQFYVNDIYENDNFDDEMNYFDSDEDEDENMDHLRGGDKNGLSGFAGMCTLSDDELEQENYGSQKDASSVTNRDSEKDIGQGMKQSSTRFQETLEDKKLEKAYHYQPKSYSDIYDLSDEEELPVEKPKSSNEHKSNKPAEQSKITNYADIYVLSEDEVSIGSSDDADDADSKFTEFCSNFEIQNEKPTKNNPGSPAPETHLNSPSRLLDASHSNQSPSAFKTPERKILTSPLRQSVKYHGVSSLLDNDIQGTMRNLYYIDEAGEDKFLENSLDSEEYYLDEINGIPEDFDFSDDEGTSMRSLSPLSYANKMKLGAFRKTHSFSDRPLGVLKESSPVNYKLKLKNKKVTFFDHNSVQRSYSEPYASSLATSYHYQEDAGDNDILENNSLGTPVTPSNSFTKPSPSFTQNSSLSPIQESTTSSDASPKLS